LGINRSRVYYQPKPVSSDEIALRRQIYEIWNERNHKGSRTIRAELLEYYSLIVNRKRVQRIMGVLGIHGILPKRNLSKPGDLQYKYPYYLGGMNIHMPNQVWATDLTYVKLPTGTMYVISLLDVFSRYIVGYVITNTLDTSGCIECLDQALMSHHGAPQLLNSDQGSQYTSYAWVNKLQQHNITISMDAKGRWSDNIYMERFWRTLKYECIFALGIETVAQLYLEVARYMHYYNNRRLHSALGYKTPASVYLATPELPLEYRLYCDWPPKEERVKVSWRTVKTTVSNRLPSNL
jgi:putative transposase